MFLQRCSAKHKRYFMLVNAFSVKQIVLQFAFSHDFWYRNFQNSKGIGKYRFGSNAQCQTALH